MKRVEHRDVEKKTRDTYYDNELSSAKRGEKLNQDGTTTTTTATTTADATTSITAFYYYYLILLSSAIFTDFCCYLPPYR